LIGIPDQGGDVGVQHGIILISNDIDINRSYAGITEGGETR